MTWVEIQETVDSYFKRYKYFKVKTIKEKEGNGYNWIIFFHRLTTDTNIYLHTRLIFKLDENMRDLRQNSFLYLYDFGCKYKKQNFNSLDDLMDKFVNIFENNVFGEDVKQLNEFFESPVVNINTWLYDNKISDITVLDFDYSPKVLVCPCQNLNYEFTLTFSNNITNEMVIHRENGDEDFKIFFKDGENITTYRKKSLGELNKFIGFYIKNKLIN